MLLVSSTLFLSLLCRALTADPSNYEYYTEGGIKSGLKADSNDFTLNGRPIRLLSGSLHYFRVVREQWRDRLIKFKAAGLNTVQTYTAWNLHEEKQGHFDFETGYLNLAEFLKEAKAADLFVYIRIGPFINAEWEMGGLPSWLLNDPNMRVRHNYKPYMDAVGKYFEKILSIINEYQFTKGGPVIALQFENEFWYGTYSNDDKEYFTYMKNVIDKSGFTQLLSNCDHDADAAKAAQHLLPGVLETYNGNSNMYNGLMSLRAVQPNKPLYVTEFWTGWFDAWGDANHHGMAVSNFEKEVTEVLFHANASINFYMFIGGTNFGFTAGGSGNSAITTSYDYNAPLSESGNYNDKYQKTRELILKLNKERNLPKINIPEPPKVEEKAAYGDIKIKDSLSLNDLLSKITSKSSTEALHMERYDQAFGFIVYRFGHKKFTDLKLQKGVNDHAYIHIDDKLVATAQGNKDFDHKTNDNEFGSSDDHIIDVLVENMGRDRSSNLNAQQKGLNGEVLVDNQKVPKYDIFNMEFKSDYVNGLKALKGQAFAHQTGPTLHRAELDIKDTPKDTFLRFEGFTRGSVFVNGFNIGRYSSAGPQKTLYVPSPVLKTGANDVYIFELQKPSDKLVSVSQPNLG